MPSLFEPSVRTSMQSRVDTLTAATQPLWGRMNVGQMVVHCGMQLKLGLGEMQAAHFKSPVGRFPLKHLVIYVLPTPKGVPTLPEIRDPLTGDFQKDQGELKTLIGRFAAIPGGTTMPVHAAFGTLSHRQWGLLAAKHLDHHLKQFGA